MCSSSEFSSTEGNWECKTGTSWHGLCSELHLSVFIWAIALPSDIWFPGAALGLALSRSCRSSAFTRWPQMAIEISRSEPVHGQVASQQPSLFSVAAYVSLFRFQHDAFFPTSGLRESKVHGQTSLRPLVWPKIKALFLGAAGCAHHTQTQRTC